MKLIQHVITNSYQEKCGGDQKNLKLGEITHVETKEFGNNLFLAGLEKRREHQSFVVQEMNSAIFGLEMVFTAPIDSK